MKLACAHVFLLLALSRLVLIGATAAAAPPKLDFLFPAGVERGQTVTVTAGGSFDQWPVEARVDGAGVALQAEAEKGQLQVTVEPDARPGVYYVRLFDEQGASQLRPLLVGSLPEVLEAEPNDEPGGAQAVTVPITINGRLAKSGDVDGFAVTLDAGETLVASLEANFRLGSPMDAVLQICSADGLFVLEQNDDSRGLDPQLIFRAPQQGTYLVRTFAFPATPNSSIAYAGGDTFIYRLTLTTGGFVDHAFPLSLQRGQATPLQLMGWNVPEAAGTLTVTPQEQAETEWVFQPELAESLCLPVHDHPSVVVAGSGLQPEPHAIELPVSVTGRLGEPGQVDAFSFQAEKDQKLVFCVESRALGYPLDAVLAVSDAEGKVLAEVDDVARQADPEIAWTVPANGSYRLTVRDLHQHGGLRYVYRLTARQSTADFALKLEADTLVLQPGQPLEVPVTIERKEGFSGEIEIQAVGLPEGVTAAAVNSLPEGDSAKAVTLTLTADVGGSSGPLRIVGSSQELSRSRTARFAVNGLQAEHTDLWLTVQAKK